MKTILAADIGGTNSRFAAFQSESGLELEMRESIWLKTGDVDSLPELLDELAASDFGLSPMDADISVLAVPGLVVQKKFSHPPNMNWSFDLTDQASHGRFRRVEMINDFVAQAYACRTDAVADAEVLHPGNPEDDGVVGVIGAGTGLGHSALIRTRGGYKPVPSEAGHVSFSFTGKREREFEQFMLKRVRECYCQVEEVVSGSGLSRIHQFLTGEKLDPFEVAATFGPDSETMRWFARFYARAARNYALMVAALGGLYITGGVAGKNPELIRCPGFMEEFQNSNGFRELLLAVPVILNLNQESGLFGAALHGVLALRGLS